MSGRLPVRVKLGDGTSKTLNDRFTQLQNRQQQQQQQPQRPMSARIGGGGFGAQRRFNNVGSNDFFDQPPRQRGQLHGVHDGRVERRSGGIAGFQGPASASHGGGQRGGFGRGRGRFFVGLNRNAAAAALSTGPRRVAANTNLRFNSASSYSRGRGGASGRGGGGTRQRGGRGGRGGQQGAANKDALDRELEAYMQNTNSALNRDLNAYYKDAKLQDDF